MNSALDHFERAVVGSTLVGGSETFAIASEFIVGSHFYDSDCRLIWHALESLAKRSALGDAASIYQGLMETSADTLPGQHPPRPVMELVDVVAMSGFTVGIESIPTYARAVKAASLRRQFARSLDQAKDLAARPDGDLRQAAALVSGIANLSEDKDGSQTLDSIWDIEPPSAEPGGLSWGLGAMDDKWPLCPGRFAIVAAPPGTGKTVLATQAGLATAKNGEQVAFLSFEMTAIDIKQRVKQRVKQREDWLKNFYLPSRDGVNVDTIGQTIERLAKRGAKLVIVDYIQRIPGGEDSNEVIRIATASRACADAALRCGVAVLGLSQMNREATKHKDKPRPPTMSDLKGSSALECDADYILFLWDKDDSKRTAEDEAAPRELQLVIGKNRHGGDHKTRQVVFEPATQTIRPGTLRPAVKASQYNAAPADSEDLFG